MRKVFLDELPKKYGKGSNNKKECVDWKNSIGYKVKFVYDDIEGEIEITDYISKGQKLTIKYNERTYGIGTSCFLKCALGGALGIISKDFKYNIGDKFGDIELIDKEIRVRNRNDGRKENQKWYKYYCHKCGWTDGWIEESRRCLLLWW